MSVRPWNCKASAGNKVYWMLVAGCGDGNVIKSYKGFLTKSNTLTSSPFFRAFSIPGQSHMTFSCQYIVCTDTSCNGVSLMKGFPD